MDNLTIIYPNKKYNYSYWLAVNKVIDEITINILDGIVIK